MVSSMFMSISAHEVLVGKSEERRLSVMGREVHDITIDIE